MKHMKTGLCGFVVALVLICGAAHGQVTFHMIGEGMATDMSADGSVVVGNFFSYEAWRWTKHTGIVGLGMGSGPSGSIAGSPDVSDDGTRVSAMILLDDTLATWGLWTEGSGWQHLMPPAPSDGGLMGAAYGSAWGLSGDGKTVVGLYWRSGQTGGSAHAARWTEATGVVDLGSGGGNSRANDADYDGDVIVGWDEDPGFGTWWPTVWVDGVRHVLDTPDAFTEATCVSPDGKMIGGMSLDTTSANVGAAVWRWNGTAWDKEYLGVLAGTFPGYGQAIAFDMSADGSVVVGYNRFDFAPAPATGFIWTAADGMVNVEDFLADNGVTIPPGFDILGLNAISDDGKIMAGLGQDTAFPFTYRSFMIYVGDAALGANAPSTQFQIGQNYPNPFNPSTTIPVTMSRSGSVRLDIYNVNGQRVRHLHNGDLPAGMHHFSWNGVDDGGGVVASGVYFARLTDPAGASMTRRMVLLK